MLIDLQSNVRFDPTSRPSNIVPDPTKQRESSHPRGEEAPPPDPEDSTPLPILHG